MLSYQETPIREINDPLLKEFDIRLLIKREDLNHPYVSGNKWWKLKYNLEEARIQGCDTILTFGGAFSNHIYATAAAAKECGFKSIGIIRGEETLPLNDTLSFAQEAGMEIHYRSRELYRQKNEPEFLRSMEKHFGKHYLIPEGGTNQTAIKGVREFARSLRPIPFDFVCLPFGTGGTLAGFVRELGDEKKIIGYSVLKGIVSKSEFHSIQGTSASHENWRIETGYHHGGYAKISPALIDFIRAFEVTHNIRLDPIYTGKMMWGIFEDIRKGLFPKGCIILAIHTGGLQGWNGIRERYPHVVNI